jgi:hypothetical protein
VRSDSKKFGSLEPNLMIEYDPRYPGCAPIDGRAEQNIGQQHSQPVGVERGLEVIGHPCGCSAVGLYDPAVGLEFRHKHHGDFSNLVEVLGWGFADR